MTRNESFLKTKNDGIDLSSESHQSAEIESDDIVDSSHVDTLRTTHRLKSNQGFIKDNEMSHKDDSFDSHIQITSSRHLKSASIQNYNWTDCERCGMRLYDIIN